MTPETWVWTLSDEETNVYLWTRLSEGRWLAVTRWGPRVFEHERLVLDEQEGWLKL